MPYTEFTTYDKDGVITNTGMCLVSDVDVQVKDDESIILEKTDVHRQKVVGGKIVNKSQQELEAEQPPPIPFEQQSALITNEQWQEVLSRISKLEGE